MFTFSCISDFEQKSRWIPNNTKLMTPNIPKWNKKCKCSHNPYSPSHMFLHVSPLNNRQKQTNKQMMFYRIHQIYTYCISFIVICFQVWYKISLAVKALLSLCDPKSKSKFSKLFRLVAVATVITSCLRKISSQSKCQSRFKITRFSFSLWHINW